MADTRPQPSNRPTPAPATPAPQRPVVRQGRPDPASVASLIAEAERIMGVKPLTDGPSRPLPGY